MMAANFGQKIVISMKSTNMLNMLKFYVYL